MMPIHAADESHPLSVAFRDFIRDPAFPCVGAKAALAHSHLEVMVARDIASSWDDLRIYAALTQFVKAYKADPGLFRSFAVVFEMAGGLSEPEFENHLWSRVQSLSDKDEWHGFPYDQRVSSDVDSPHFSLSFGGEAFFVVGLHPGASRPARRFRAPVLVFNLHGQFEQLRADGRFQKMRDTIVDRDVALAGSANPMLSNFGEVSEARQYSGRQVGAGWQCPFTARKDTHRAS
jgi:hypothetical protein